MNRVERTELAREHLEQGNTLRVRALGASMAPLIRSGDVLHVERVTELVVGDVLLVEQGDDWWAHRLLDVSESGRVVLRGDAHRQTDLPLPRDAVLGRVEAVERAGRMLRLDGWRARLVRGVSRVSVLGRPILPELVALARRLRPKRPA